MPERRLDGPPATPIAGGLSVEDIRREFPFFAARPELVFLDSASTTQKPLTVIKAVTDFYAQHCASAGRNTYGLSTRAAAAVKQSRERVAKFIGATNSSDILFTHGSEALSTVAMPWGLFNLTSGDEVMVCLKDHKSVVLPWLKMRDILAPLGITISIVPFSMHEGGDYSLKSIREKASPRTRLLAMSHVHPVSGLDMEVEEVRGELPDGALIALDASHSIGRRRVNVSELGVDFLSFPGHQMFAPFGVDVLWVAPELKQHLLPLPPGSPIALAREDCLPAVLECGTPDVSAILSLQPALDFIEQVGVEQIEQRVAQLCRYLYKALERFPGIEFSPGFGLLGIVSFRFEQHPTSDVAALLAGEGILAGSGDHGLTSHLEGDDWLRVSLHVYNTEAEIDHLVAVLRANLG